jgi:hypothetical protein
MKITFLADADFNDDVDLVWAASEAEEWVNRICTLPL